jgi:hypothetical protein
MSKEPDDFESSARIVEAFAESVDGKTRELLAEIARAIRDRAIDD